ncbi:MAG: hypothetical protein WCQ91_02145, partial [Planctomycetota bacterium]
DPLELFFDRAAGGIPLDTGLVKGSHGAVVPDGAHETIFIASRSIALPRMAAGSSGLGMRDISGIVKSFFGITSNAP